jgi:hypothetical protein
VGTKSPVGAVKDIFNFGFLGNQAVGFLPEIKHRSREDL